MRPTLIQQQKQLEDLCEEIRAHGTVAFDTEFVSEDTYLPELCLVQLATPESCVAVDPFVVDLTPWWELMCDPSIEVVVHSAKEEIRFCLRFASAAPQNVVDIQIAEGLRDVSYPLKYERLVARVLGRQLAGAETRSDWRRRPLSPRQLEYALDDVRHALEVWQIQKESLQERGRLWWAEEEFRRAIQRVVTEFADGDWRRLRGLHHLRPRELAVVRELFYWREQAARRRNVPVRRILRDDLLVELAKRKPMTRTELLAGRDFNRRNIQSSVSEILQCIELALSLPEAQLPASVERQPRRERDQEVVPRLLALALAQRCAEMSVAMNLVGTNRDLHDLMVWHRRGGNGDPPLLATGWRALVCGDYLADVLRGRICIRVDPNNPRAIVFARHGEAR